MALHFTNRLVVTLDPTSKARAFTFVKNKTSTNGKFDLLVSYHGNSIAKYRISSKKADEEEKEEQYSLKQTYGQMDCHK